MKRSDVENLFAQAVRKWGTDKVSLSAALGTALAFAIPLPQERIKAATGSIFAGKCMGKVNDFLSQVNERVLIDIEVGQEVAKKVWCYRYDMMYGTNPDALANAAQGKSVLMEVYQSFGMDDDTTNKVIRTGASMIDEVEKHLVEWYG